MSIPYEEKKKVVEAAEVLKEYCEHIKDCEKNECLFYTVNGCVFKKYPPSMWPIHKLTRWTPEDVALAKALKVFGIDRILKDSDCAILLYDGGHKCVGTMEADVFLGLAYEAGISIDTIIEEAEG